VRLVSATAGTAPVPSHCWGGAAALDDAATPHREKRMAETFAAAANLARLRRR
jgi:hypothetical protein